MGEIPNLCQCFRSFPSRFESFLVLRPADPEPIEGESVAVIVLGMAVRVTISTERAEAYVDSIEGLLPWWARWVPASWLFTFGLDIDDGVHAVVRPRWAWLERRLGVQ